jgi:hypothetical protein
VGSEAGARLSVISASSCRQLRANFGLAVIASLHKLSFAGLTWISAADILFRPTIRRIGDEMFETIEKLLILQDRDRQLRRVKTELDHIEPERQMFKSRAAGAQSSLDAAKQRVKELEFPPQGSRTGSAGQEADDRAVRQSAVADPQE